MKNEHVIVMILCYIWLMLIGTTIAINGSYCCSNPNEEIFSIGEENSCLDTATNATTKFSLTCFDNLTIVMTNDSDLLLKLKPDGRLAMMLDEVNEWVSLEQGEFCIGNQTVNGTLTPPVAVVCFDAEEPEVVTQEVLGYCMATSSVFLAFTALVYLLLPELRDLQGKSIISLCISLAVANALMAVMKIMEYTDMNWCAARGFFAYFFLISSFFWMNAIAVQILFSIKLSSIGNYGFREFMWYAVYGWGIPTVLTVILIVVNYHPGHHVKPGIGHQHCWFLDMARTWIFMYSVMSLLMAANVAIFIYTSVYLWKYTFSSSHVRALKYKFWMMLRLFIIMGLPWIFEMVTSLTPSHIVWAILDVSNCLQGIIIFIILVVFRRRVIKALHKRNALCCLNNVAEKYLALAADDEDDIVTHTIAVPLEEK